MTDAAEVVRLCFCDEILVLFQRDEPVNGEAGTRDAGSDGPRQWLALSLRSMRFRQLMHKVVEGVASC